jgi:hypothetical protein
LQQLSPATPEAKQKYKGIPQGRHNRVASSLPLSCLFKKVVAKALDLAKKED